MTLRPSLRLFVLLGSGFFLLQPLAGRENPALFGDAFYRQKKYGLARLEYEKALLEGTDESERRELQAKLGLTLLRQKKVQTSLKVLEGERGFPLSYLRMFTALKAGLPYLARQEQDWLTSNPETTKRQQDLSRLLGGTLFLEAGDYEGAREYYSILQRETEFEAVRKTSGRVLAGMDAFARVPKKSPSLAATLSTLLPGAGQIYSDFYADGVTAFFFNSMFLGSAAIMYNLERKAGVAHSASGVFGLVGLLFYVSNISGAFAAAHRHNIHHERTLQQNIRDRFFNLDFLEQTSGLNFSTKF